MLNGPTCISSFLCIFSGFISELLACILGHLQMTDFISVYYGQPGPLNQIQTPLREFLARRVLKGAAPFPENVRSAVEALVESARPDLEDTVVGFS